MVFSSIVFLFAFLPAVLFSYFVLAPNRVFKNYVLLIFSLLFYAWGGFRLVPLMLYSVVTNYFFGRMVTHTATKRVWMIVAIVSNIGMLFYFKYVSFLTENLHQLFPSFPLVDIVLPIGISFYTFQGLSYVIDVYRESVPCEKNPANVALYIMLFPQLVAGPIVRYSTIASEIKCRHESICGVSAGFQRLLFGLGKKVLIANQIGLLADTVFKQSEDYLSTGLVWLGILAYSFQIFFVFSGYSDIAIGLGEIFGFHFLENFDYPYISASITEFWHRWHISLSTWFRDYLYIPLGGNRVTKKRHILNLLIVWSLTGLWHGAAWNFLIWGLYYGIILIAEKYLLGGYLARLPKYFQHLYALFFILIGWLLFRATDLTQILTFFKAMFGSAADGFWNHQATYLILQYRWDFIIALLFSLPIYPTARWLLTKSNTKLSNFILNWGIPFFALGVGYLSVMNLLASDFNPFIYFQF